ncbi:MAG: hypothetical protein DUD39_17520 [Coriobacteriaceae bacterium]|nr:MAG: hypothetical protein DUD39_17520 [Coriobacteriaceae bacterium]
MQAWHTPEGYDVGCQSQRRKLKGMCHYKHLKPTGEGLHSQAAWHKGRPIAYIAAEIGRDSSSVCHKLKRNARHGRYGACATQKEGGRAPQEMQGEKEAFRPCAYAEGALTHHGQTLVLRGDRRHLRLEGGGRCVVEPADYSTVRSIAAALEVSGSGPQGQVRRYLRSKRPKTRGKIEILRSVKDRPKRPMRGLASESGETTRSWQRDPCACLCLPTGQ